MNLNLEVVCQSDAMPGRISSLYVITCNDEYVYGRDMQGSLIQWRASDLTLLRIVYLQSIGDESDRKTNTAIPTVSHGLFLWEDRVLVVSPYGDLLQLNANTLEFIKNTNLPARAFAESFDASVENCHTLSDCAGYVWYGDIDKGFEHKIRLDYGPIHCLRYDKLHNRHWMTTDNHGGLSIVGLHGDGIHRLELTTDDVEWLTFSDDAKLVYVACFDHYLYIFNNESKEPQLVSKIGPFKFQLKQVLFVDNNHVYVSLESGEIYRLNSRREIENQSPFGTNCIWDIVQDPNAHNRVFCPMENGSFCHIEYDANEKGMFDLKIIKHYESFGFGRIRRIKALKNGAFIAGCTNGTVLKINSAGGIDWKILTSSIVRDVSISRNEEACVAVNEAGEIIELATETGAVIWREKFEKPLWASCYYGDDILFSERCRSEKDENLEASVPMAQLYRVNGDTKEIKFAIELSGNIKRIKTLDNGNILINGNGDVTTIEYNLEERKAVKTWSIWQLNTCEDAIQFDDHVYTVTYGYQLNSYKITGEMIDCQFSPDNYPKAVFGKRTLSNIPILLVTGRGPFISLYRLNQGKPEIAQTLYIQ
jgi:outer membrane protein assembly factor BamB